MSHPVRYVVQAGDSLAGIAARLGVAGGWPVLYAANRRAVGGDPDVIRAGLVLVVPGAVVPARYTVAAGDSLAGIAAEFGVKGGWRALYAANRHRIGADPSVIRTGLVLVIPQPSGAPVPVPGQTRPRHRPVPRRVRHPSVRPGPAQHPVPAVPSPGSRARAVAGMPGWLKTTLLAAGLLIAAAFVTEPLLLARRRRASRPRLRPPSPVHPGVPGRSPARPAAHWHAARHPAGPVTQPGSPQPGSRWPGRHSRVRRSRARASRCPVPGRSRVRGGRRSGPGRSCWPIMTGWW